MLLVNSLRAGGTERNVVAFCRQIDRTRFAPELHTMLPDGELLAQVQPTGVKIECHYRNRPFDPRFAWKFSRSIARAPVDLIHVFSHAIVFYAALARRWWGCRTPMIYSEGTSLVSDDWRAAPFRWCLQQFDLYAANSPASRDKLIAEGVATDKISIIPNGHDLTTYQMELQRSRSELRQGLGLRDEELVILFCGRLQATKRVCDLLDALPLLRCPRTSLRILIAGDGPEREALQQQANRLGWSDRVIFLGFRSDVKSLMHLADVFAFPSEVEGLPNSVVEAALMQIPIVAGDIIGTRSIVQDLKGAHLVPCRQPAALAAALDQMLQDPRASRSAAIQMSQIIASEYSMENSLNRLYQCYDRAMSLR